MCQPEFELMIDRSQQGQMDLSAKLIYIPIFINVPTVWNQCVQYGTAL